MGSSASSASPAATTGGRTCSARKAFQVRWPTARSCARLVPARKRAGCLSQLPERDDGAPGIDPVESRCTSRDAQAETGAGPHSPAAM